MTQYIRDRLFLFPTLKDWALHSPKNKAENTIIIDNSDFTDEQQKDSITGPLELVLYKTAKKQKGFFCSGLMKNFAAKYITHVDITKHPQKIRNFIRVYKSNQVEQLKKQYWDL